MNIFEEILAAEDRIRPYILKTPLLESKALSKLINGKVYLKLESEQHTGSFKARGSLNKLLSLSNNEKKIGTVTASTGNHALGYARALEIVNTTGTIYLPENASNAKIKALENYSVELKQYGNDSLTTELYAKQKAKDLNKIWISPYNDPQIIGGQGTIGIELVEQIEDFDYTLVTIGGGGLISGIGTYLNQVKPMTKIIGCQPENSPEMDLSLKANKIITLPEYIDTLSDGSAGGIEEGAITFPICKNVIDECILVSEEKIASAIKFVAHTHRKIIEGAAGVAIASLIQNKRTFDGCTVVVIICGANIDMKKFKSII
ncbi:MAG: threonine/serine dehydratase [Saprospiraceae bacterium]|nr:threonine/serine dehydratase [Saprospiraceae bacterium]